MRVTIPAPRSCDPHERRTVLPPCFLGSGLPASPEPARHPRRTAAMARRSRREREARPWSCIPPKVPEPLPPAARTPEPGSPKLLRSGCQRREACFTARASSPRSRSSRNPPCRQQRFEAGPGSDSGSPGCPRASLVRDVPGYRGCREDRPRTRRVGAALIAVARAPSPPAGAPPPPTAPTPPRSTAPPGRSPAAAPGSARGLPARPKTR